MKSHSSLRWFAIKDCEHAHLPAEGVGGHSHLRDFSINDLTTWKREMSDLAGTQYDGMGTK